MSSDLRALFSDYWLAYGGWRALVCSPFFGLSALLLLATAHFWLSDPWWDQVLSVLPNLLGFTLGGFAVFLGFGDEKFKGIIAGRDEACPDEHSPYIEVCSAFLHFVLVQVLALIAAIIAKSLAFDPIFLPQSVIGCIQATRWVGDLLGYWLFLYGVSLAAAAAVAIFRVALWFDRFQTDTRGRD